MEKVIRSWCMSAGYGQWQIDRAGTSGIDTCRSCMGRIPTGTGVTYRSGRGISIVKNCYLAQAGIADLTKTFYIKRFLPRLSKGNCTVYTEHSLAHPDICAQRDFWDVYITDHLPTSGTAFLAFGSPVVLFESSTGEQLSLLYRHRNIHLNWRDIMSKSLSALLDMVVQALEE